MDTTVNPGIRTRAVAVLSRLARDLQELAAAVEAFDEARVLALDSRNIDDFQLMRDAESNLSMLIALAVRA